MPDECAEEREIDREAYDRACEAFAEQTGGHPDDMPLRPEDFMEHPLETRARYAAMPCQGVTTYSYFPKGGNGVGMEVPCGYVFNEHGDPVRCVPCQLRRQDVMAESHVQERRHDG